MLTCQTPCLLRTSNLLLLLRKSIAVSSRPCSTRSLSLTALSSNLLHSSAAFFPFFASRQRFHNKKYTLRITAVCAFSRSSHFAAISFDRCRSGKLTGMFNSLTTKPKSWTQNNSNKERITHTHQYANIDRFAHRGWAYRAVHMYHKWMCMYNAQVSTTPNANHTVTPQSRTCSTLRMSGTMSRFSTRISEKSPRAHSIISRT